LLLQIFILLLVPWIFATLTPYLPSWDVYYSAITILGVFLVAGNKNNRQIFFRELLLLLWLLITVITAHVIFAGTFSKNFFKAIGNLVWTVVFYAYAEVASKYLTNAKLDPRRKISTTAAISLAIIAWLNWARIFAANNRGEIFSMFGINMMLLGGTLLYLGITAAGFGISPFKIIQQHRLNLTSPSFFAKLSVAIVLRLMYQFNS